MKLINANIKTIGELVKRLVDGEVFHTDRSTLKFIPDSVQPFNDIAAGNYYNIDWSVIELHSLKVEAKWYEDITDPVICWAWDENDEEKSLVLIENYYPHDEWKFKANIGPFQNAEPVKPEELLQC